MPFKKALRWAAPALLLLSCGAASMALDAEDSARVDLNGEASGVVLSVLETSANCGAAKQDWGDPATRPQRLVVSAPVYEDEWQGAWVKFAPSKDGQVSVVLKGPWINKGGSLERVYVLYDCVSAEGASLSDGSFEKGGAWAMGQDALLKDRSVSLSGENCAKVWHNGGASQSFQVRKGVPVTLSFFFKKPASASSSSAPENCFLDLSKSANMGLKDEAAGDGKGGWSDQGPENDFASLDVERNYFGTAPFKILDPLKNGGKGVLVFSSPNLSSSIDLKSAQLDAGGAKASYLYLLHTACWAPKEKGPLTGRIDVAFKDGSSSSFDVVNGRDIADWWMPRSLENASSVYERHNGKSSVGLYLSKFKLSGAPREVASVKLSSTGSSIWIVLGATLSSADYPRPREQKIELVASEAWKALDVSDVKIKPGSCLDFSDLVSKDSCSKSGRVLANAAGKLAFASDPGKPVRFMGASISLPLIDKMSREQLAEFVAIVKRSGYNLIRFHFPEFYLMKDSKAELEFNAEAFDKTLQLVKLMNDNGVYLYLDIVTSWSGYMPGTGWSDKAKAMHLKSRIYFEPAIREHWRKAMEKLLLTVNPYSGLRLVDDPAVAAILLFNEQEACFVRDEFNSPAASKAWGAWLERKYKSEEALAKAWGRSESFASAQFKMAFLDDKTVPGRAIDAAVFIAETELEFANWGTSLLRSAGYKGIVTQYDAVRNLETLYVKKGQDMISMHTYFSHPTNYLAKGSCISQLSSTSSLLNYCRDLASTRFLGKPYFITEYGHVLWNRYRFEEGLAMGAYCSFQDFDGLMAHSVPVDLEISEPMRPFVICAEPIAKASQVIAQHLFLRGDVKPAPSFVETALDFDSVFSKGNAMMGLEKQSMLSLVTGFGVSWDKLPASMESKVAAVERYGESLALKGSSPEAAPFSLPAALALLKKGGVLPESNVSDPAAGIYESSTGELLIDSKRGVIRVSTPRSEAVSFVTPDSFKLRALSVDSASVPAALALLSRDGKPIESASRLLLVVSTNALNSGATYGNAERSVLISNGVLPILMQTGEFSVSAKLSSPELFKVWALGLDGSRKELVPSKASDGALLISVDTSKLKNGPTPFFEIAAEKP